MALQMHEQVILLTDGPRHAKNLQSVNQLVVRRARCQDATSYFWPEHCVYELLQVVAGQDLDIEIERFEQLL